jgi:NADH-quinone oxidoreductase subunit L
MGFLLEHAYIIPLIPAASFVLILLFGKRLPYKGAEIGITALSVCFALALATNVQWRDHVNDAEHKAEVEHEEEVGTEGEEEHGLPAGESAAVAAPTAEEEHVEFDVEPIEKSWTWWSNGEVEFTVGMLLDGPGVMMLFVVTLISLLVHVYSTDYVGGDRRYTHYFAFLSLFSASMLGLIMSQNTLQLLTCWELVGLCSFALIGHWWEEKPNSDAALKAFLTNRVGDVRRHHPVLRRRPDVRHRHHQRDGGVG